MFEKLPTINPDCAGSRLEKDDSGSGVQPCLPEAKPSVLPGEYDVGANELLSKEHEVFTQLRELTIN